MRRALWLGVCCLCVAACLGVAGCGVAGSAAPTPTPAPVLAPVSTATALPAAPPGATLDAATADLQDEFLTNVNDLTSEVETLAGAQCNDLTAETQANPTEITEMRGFAATLQRVSVTQPALNSDDVRSALNDLGQALAQLDATLNNCGIKLP